MTYVIKNERNCSALIMNESQVLEWARRNRNWSKRGYQVYKCESNRTALEIARS